MFVRHQVGSWAHVMKDQAKPIKPCAAAASAPYRMREDRPLPHTSQRPVSGHLKSDLQPSDQRSHYLTIRITGVTSLIPVLTHITSTTEPHWCPAPCIASTTSFADHSKPPPAFVTAGGGRNRPSRLHAVHQSANTTILRSKHPHKSLTLPWLRSSRHQRRARPSTA